MNSRRDVLKTIGALPLLAPVPLLVSCSKPAPSKITIGMVTFPGYGPLYVARDLGLFQNVDVNLIRIEAVGDLRSALLGGRIDMYLATYDIFESIETRAPIGKMVYAIDTSVGADGVAVDGSIKSVSDVVGRRIGAEPGFPPHFVLTFMLYKAGHKLSDSTIIDMPSGDVPSAFASGNIDVAATYEPYLSKCLGVRPNSKILVSSANIPGLISDFMVASEDAIAQKTEAIKNVITGWERALNVISTKPDTAFPIMAKAFNVSVGDMRDFARVVKWLGAAENRHLFTSKGEDGVYQRYSEVNKALRLNNAAITASSARDFVIPKFVNLG